MRNSLNGEGNLGERKARGNLTLRLFGEDLHCLQFAGAENEFKCIITSESTVQREEWERKKNETTI